MMGRLSILEAVANVTKVALDYACVRGGVRAHERACAQAGKLRDEKEPIWLLLKCQPVGQSVSSRHRMDFFAILIFPFSALVAFVDVVGAAVARRRRPRLIWPLVFSTLVALPMIVRSPTATDFDFWLFATSMMVVLPAAIGTVTGALLERTAIAGIRWFKSRLCQKRSRSRAGAGCPLWVESGRRLNQDKLVTLHLPICTADITWCGTARLSGIRAAGSRARWTHR